MTVAKGSITESTKFSDLKFEVFETINQSNFEVCLLGLFRHSQGVTTESRRLVKILNVIRGKSARVCITKVPREIFFEALGYLKRFSSVGFERFKSEFEFHSGFCKCTDNSSRSPWRDR
jgi:hypothetical protein